jgi:hypothetical protein
LELVVEIIITISSLYDPKVEIALHGKTALSTEPAVIRSFTADLFIW